MRHLFYPRASRVSQIVFIALFLCLVVASGDLAGPPQRPASGPKIWLQEAQRLSVTHVAARPNAQLAALGLAAGLGKPLAMTHGDFDADGVEDLAVGYATLAGGAVVIHRGNLDAFAPQSHQSFEAIGRGEFPPPFLPKALVFDVPVQPDFIVAGDFTGRGELDLAVAARGGSTFYILPNEGKGHFGTAQAVGLPGGVTALAAGAFGARGRVTNLLVGVASQTNSYSLLVLGDTGLGLGVQSVHPLAASVSDIQLGEFGDLSPDAAFLSGGQIEILRSSTMQLAPVSLPISVRAFAIGSFIFDRNEGSEIAALASDGSVHIVVRDEFDPRMYTNEEFRAIRQARLSHQPLPSFSPVRSFPSNGWKIEETFPGVASLGSGQSPVIFRTRVSVHAADDVMVLNGSGQMALISHAGSQPGAQSFLPGQVSLRPHSGTPIMALSLRTNVDVRPGVVALHQGQIGPTLINPIPDPTFNVNTTNDGVFPGACAANTANECTLREAILEADGDTIMVPAGTYTLTIARVEGDCTGKFGALSIGGSPSGGDGKTVTIIGAAQTNTIIQAGTIAYNQGTANGVDMVMNVNEDLGTTSCPVTSASASLSNLTIQNGHNLGTVANFDGDGGCMEFETGSNGTANLTLTDVTLQNCDTTDGNGGGLANFNVTNPGTGLATISTSIIQGNSAKQVTGGDTGTGGGIFVSDPSRISLSNSQVKNNLATNSGGGNAGSGGGITITSNESGSRQTVIHASTISGNQAAGLGGGIDTTANLMIDQGSVISSNLGGTASVANSQNGGGIYMHPSANGCPDACTDSVTIKNVTIIGNSTTGNGGGISNGDISGGTVPTAGPLTISFSRLAGNTAAGSGSNIRNDGTSITAMDNWWGTNSPSTTISDINSGTTTFDPFIVLTNTASPNLLKVGDTSTITASFLQDNHGTAISSSDIGVLFGLPATGSIFPDTPNHGSLSNVQTTIQSGTSSDPGEAMETYTATSGGIDILNAVVDQATVPATVTVLFPPSISKGFGATHIPVFTFSPTTTTLTFTITNPNTANDLHGVAFTDNLPSGLAVADATASNTCGGTLSGATAGSTSVSLSGGTISFNSGGTFTCTVVVDVKGVTDGVQNNTTQNVTATDVGGLTGNTATATITVINPPSTSNSFSPNTIHLGGTSALTITVSNSNVNTTLNGIAFTDTLPGGVVVASPNNLTTTCSGTPGTGAASVSLSGATLSPGASCMVSATVQGNTAGVETNMVFATSTNGGTGPASTGNLTVVGPPSIAKAFNPNVAPLGGTTSLQFTIADPNPTVTLTGVGFTDNLPPGLASSSSSSTVCGGTLTTTLTSITLSAASVNFTAPCVFSVPVTGVTPGSYLNTTGAVTSIEGGTGNAAIAPVTVVAPPMFAKAFFPTTIPIDGTSTLTFTITNPAVNTAALTGVGFTDVLPSGLTVPTASGAVCGGTLTTVSPGTIILGGGTIAINSACQFPVTVTGAASGQYTNTTSPVVSANGGPGNAATANLAVQAATTTTVTASPSTTITLGDTVTFTATVTATGSTTPTGLVTFFDGNTPLGSGTLTIVAGVSQASFSTSLLSHAGSPHSVTATYQATPAFTGSTSSPVSITVNERPSLTMVFLSLSSVTVGQSSPPVNITVTVNDKGSSTPPGLPNTFTPTGAPATGRTGFTSTLFADGLVLVAGGTDANNNVLQSAEIYSVSGGAFSSTGSLNTARTGAVAVLLPTGKVLVAGGSSDGTAGHALNTAELFDPSAGTFSTAGSGSGNVMTAARFGATATLLNTGKVLIAGGQISGSALNSAELYDPIADTFTATGNLNTGRTGHSSTILPNGKVFVVGGSSDGTAAGALSSAELFDPAGNGGAGAFTSITSTLSTGRWQPEAALLLSGKVLIAGGQNSGGALASADLYDETTNIITPLTGTMSQARANGSAVALPNGTVVLAGGTTSQVVDLFDVDSNQFNQTGSLQQSDNGLVSTLLNNGQVLVVGLTTAGTPASDAELYSPSFNPFGTVNFSSSETTDLFSTPFCALVPQFANVSTCSSFPPTISVQTFNVGTSPHQIAGFYSGDAVHSLSFNSAPLTVNQDGTITTITSHTPNPSTSGQPVNVSVQVTPGIPGPTPTGTVTVSDGAGHTCIATLSPSGFGSSGSCSIAPTATVTLTATYPGDQNFTGSTSPGVTQTLASPPTIAKSFGATSIPLGSSTPLTFTIHNPNGIALSGVAFTDSLPSGLVVATPNGLNNTCGGTVSATAGGGSIGLSGGSLASNTCAVSVNVTGTTLGVKNNTTGAVSSTNAGTGNTASASITVKQATTTSSVTVSPTSQDYSDPVTIKATLSPASLLGQAPATTATFKIGTTTFAGPVTLTASGGSLTATASGSILLEPSTTPYTVTVVFGGTLTGPNGTNPNFSVGSPTTMLTVTKETPVITIATNNPQVVQVSAPGGTSPTFSLSATISNDSDSPNGVITNAEPVTVTLTPVGPGSSIIKTATPVNNGGPTGTLTATASFSSVPVNVYIVTFSVGGNFYTGSATSTIVIFDPSLGFITGGGTIIDPNNGDRANFGINMQYNKNGQPKGQFVFVLHTPTGDVVLKSNAMTALAIVSSSPAGPFPNNEAIATGKATLNGVGNYTFQVIAIDYGSGSLDQIGLQVKDPNGNIVAAFTFNPVTLAGGIIHVPH